MKSVERRLIPRACEVAELVITKILLRAAVVVVVIGRMMAVSTKNRIKRIYEALPKTDCGQCGIESCAKFARAVAEGNASPFGCRRDPGVGYVISGILREDMTGGYASSWEALGQDIKRLYREVDNILSRIEKLKVGR